MSLLTSVYIGTEWNFHPFVRTDNAPTCSDCLVKPGLIRLGDPKFFTWRKVGPAQRVTLLPSQKVDQARRVSLLNWFATFCNEIYEKLVGSSAKVARQSGRQVILSFCLGQLFSFKRCLSAITFYLSFRPLDGKLLRLVQLTRLTLYVSILDS